MRRRTRVDAGDAGGQGKSEGQMNKAVIVLAGCVVMAAGCDEKLSDVAGPTPNLTPTFSAIQRDIFDAPDATGRPACTSCHNPQLARLNGNLNLAGSAAYGQL